ncbi:MAG: phosphoribosylformylglycinamidine synthase subunit PurS [Tepidisphaeraceae bacterium]
MIYRIDVWPTTQDESAAAVAKQAQQAGVAVSAAHESRVYFLETDAPADAVTRVAAKVLADPVTDSFQLVTAPYADGDKSRVEVHLKPGVMDPTAASATMALNEAGLPTSQVRTGRAFKFDRVLTADELKTLAARVLANGVVESVYYETHLPKSFAVANIKLFELRSVPMRDLDDAALATLSRQGHLFLNVTEMRAVRDYFVAQGREPTDIELETVAQTWSEHCVHKTLKSTVDVYDDAGTKLRSYDNLIKETIFASTMELMKRRNDGFCLSVFKDNAGVIKFDDTDAVCFKVETHNRPSAIEPYGGAATGIGGCIRDVLGTGLAAKPIANTNVFCVAYPDREIGKSVSRKDSAVSSSSTTHRLTDLTTLSPLPPGVIHPKRVLQQVVAGVRDYGNRMGIPTVNGAVYFDENYVGNPLVFAGCVGLIPNDKITKKVNPGDAIVVMGGRTGRDGIHGATFSSAEISSTAADEFSHAVQIGNAIEQKRMMDVLLQARDLGLYSAVTDCGAGGLSSAIGEMGADVGANVTLEKVPLKYDGLRYDEIWISEAQERMVLSVPQDNVAALLKLSAGENVEATVIGTFGTDNAELILNYHNKEVGRVAMHFLHDGIPMPTRKAIVDGRTSIVEDTRAFDNRHTTFDKRLLATLAHPNVASKHWIIRQYDHEVQGGSVIKPLIGPKQIGPSDAAVVRPKLSSNAGVVLSKGLAPSVADPYKMAIAAIDEAIRNAVCVGADVDKLAILDNFCWPGTDDEKSMGSLVRTCEACRDAALAFGVPFISGKDSLHNQFTDKSTGRVTKIPNTLLVSAIGVIDDVSRAVTMDFKNKNSRVVLIRANKPFDLATLNTVHRTMSGLVRGGRFSAVHDVSDGGFATAAAEMSIASGLGLIASNALLDPPEAFEERPGGYVAELKSWDALDEITQAFDGHAEVIELGITQGFKRFTLTTEKTHVVDIAVDDLTAAWRGTLDW